MNYFALNAMVGRGGYDTPEFATAAELVAHLDYLGIDRSLVYSVKARDFGPHSGNRELLAELAPYRERLFPSFLITPADYYERGTIGFYRQTFASGVAPALRLCPAHSRFSVRQVERTLATLADLQPLVLMDAGLGASEPDLYQLADLAAKYPAVKFVMCQKMWPGFMAVMDIMWRCPNVYLDISWLHMRGTIELVREEFGADRLLFGIGFKSHYGAAIGALAHAAITPAEREAIAHGNLERLLGIKPLAAKLAPEAPLLAHKPLWRRFRNGESLGDVAIIDAHGHTGPHTRGWCLRDSDPQTYVASLARHMDSTGARTLFLSAEEALFSEAVAGNRKLEEYTRPYPGRFRGYFVYNPLYKDEITPALIDEFFANSFWAGFKILPSYWRIPVTDPGYNLVWEYAGKHRLPVLIHTWDDPYNSPAMLSEIAARYPNAFLILGHSGGGTRGRIEAEELAARHKNVFLEFCGTFCSDRPLTRAFERVSPEQFLFGSDTGAHNQAFELSGYLSLPLPDAQLLPGLRANMERILSHRR